MGKWNSKGEIIFLGRKDGQVKINGSRIEIGEIENSLIQFHGLNNVKVKAIDNNNGERFLVAYYTSEKEYESSELVAFLRKQLPYYMIPAVFVWMESFPLTPSGKVDSKALPDPAKNGVGLKQEYVAPTNDIQKQLVHIWKDVLGVEEVGILDNFFDLGGHSLKAAKLLSRVQKRLSVKLAMQDIFANPNIETLSKVIAKSARQEYTAIKRVPDQEHYALSFGQKRLWLLDQFEQEHVANNIPKAYVFDNLNTEALEMAVKALIERHEVLRTGLEVIDKEPRQKIYQLADLDFKIGFENLTQKEDRLLVARQIISHEANLPFDLAQPPLMRAKVIHVEEEQYLFLMTIHHIISDGWSLEVIKKELFQLYTAFDQGLESPLSKLSIQYRDYTTWQNDLFSSDEIKPHQDYWFSKFNDEIPVIDIPSSNPRPPVHTVTGANFNFRIDKKTTEGIKELGQRNRATTFMVLLTAIKALFNRYTGITDIVIGTPTAGRNFTEL